MPPDPTSPTVPTDRLWTITDVAAYLQITEAEAPDLLATSAGLPQPLQLGRLVRWSPRDWLAWEDPNGIHSVERPRPFDRLWSIGDVATFLGMSENTANAVINAELSDTPHPVVEGRLRRWDPQSWWDWSAARATATPNKKAKGTTPKANGRSTLV